MEKRIGMTTRPRSSGLPAPGPRDDPGGLPASNARPGGLFEAIQRGVKFPSVVHEELAS